MTGPEEIWIDNRVVRTLKTEPDEDAADRGVVQIRYINAERVAEMVQASRGGDEFLIHIQLGAGGIMFALTNYGRIFRQSLGVGVWEVVDVPDFGEGPGA